MLKSKLPWVIFQPNENIPFHIVIAFLTQYGWNITIEIKCYDNVLYECNGWSYSIEHPCILNYSHMKYWMKTWITMNKLNIKCGDGNDPAISYGCVKN